MVINGAIVSDLDMMYLESVLQEELSLVMMMRYVHNDFLFKFTLSLYLTREVKILNQTVQRREIK